jgi:hypothetical protein
MFPFNTTYPSGYLEWFLEVAEKQKQDLISREVLRKDAPYASRDIHIEKPDYRKYAIVKNKQ